MSIQPETEIDNSEFELANDKTGLLEIQKALEEIEKLNSQEDQEITVEPSEKPEEETEESEPEAEQEVAEEVPVKKEKKEDKLWKVKKDKYRALAEKEALLQENLHLKQLLSDSVNSGTYHFSKSAYADLERAKESKKKAIENGDTDALIESDIAITEAIQTINELKKWSAENDGKTKQVVATTPIPEPGFTPTLVEQEIASDWLDNHSYLQPSSSTYNPQLANKVADFINYLDDNLKQTGNHKAYFSDAYFQTIENYIDELQNQSQKIAKKIDSNAHVGSVRNSYTSPSNSNGKNPDTLQIKLSPDERRMCMNAGISEAEWAKYKLEQLKEQRKGK